jgi:acetyl esterase
VIRIFFLDLLLSLLLTGFGWAETNIPSPVLSQDTNEVTPLTLPGAESSVFKKIGDVELRLHVVKPKDWKPSDKRACWVTFFGGGWTSGTPARSITYAKWAAKNGLVGVAPDYRTRNRFNTQPEDCVADGRAAVRWIQDHAAELGVDPAKIVVQGSSAGGHVAAWTAIPDPVTPDTASDPVPKPVPMGLILLWPVTDTGTNGYGGPKRFGNDEARANNLSVTGRMPVKMPHTLGFHGTADKTVKFDNSQAFTDKMKANGNSCELVVFPDAPHSPNSSKEGEKGKVVKAKIEDESLKFLEKLGLVSPEQASAGAKATDKEEGE